MESIIEIIPHTAHLKPVAELELFIYVSLISMVILIGIAGSQLRRE